MPRYRWVWVPGQGLIGARDPRLSSPLPGNCQQTANVNSNGRVARGHLAHTQCPEVRQESSKTDELSGGRRITLSHTASPAKMS
jgi:hypothetical protein